MKIIIFSGAILTVLLLTACSSPLKVASELRKPAQYENFELLCKSKIDPNIQKATLISLLHRDYPDQAEKLGLSYVISVKYKDGMIQNHNLPAYQSKRPFQEISGINFQIENGAPFFEYRVSARVNWMPLNTDYQFPIFQGEWKKTDKAGLCLNFNPPTRIKISFVGDLSSKGISRLIRAQLNYEIGSQKIQYYIPFKETTAESEVLILNTSSPMTYQLTWVQNGQTTRGTPKIIEMSPSDSGILVTLTEEDFK